MNDCISYIRDNKTSMRKIFKKIQIINHKQRKKIMLEVELPQLERI